MHEETKMIIKQARERYHGFSPESMKNNLTEQFTQMISHGVTNESIARINRMAIEKDISISKAVQAEVEYQVTQRAAREEARFHDTARNVLKSLETIAVENESMKRKLKLVFFVGVKNKSITEDAFGEAECRILENEILHQLLPIADCIQGIKIKLGKSVYIREVS